MRLGPAIRAGAGLACIWAAMALVAQAWGREPPASPDACRLGAVLIAEPAAGTVFDVSWPKPVGPGADRKGLAAPLELASAHIPRSLKAAARKGHASNLFQACPSLASELPAGDRMATDEDLAKVNPATGRSGFYLTTLLTPVVDRTGTSALVYEFHRCFGLCGCGGLYLYRKAPGRWVRSEPAIYRMVS